MLRRVASVPVSPLPSAPATPVPTPVVSTTTTAPASSAFAGVAAKGEGTPPIPAPAGGARLSPLATRFARDDGKATPVDLRPCIRDVGDERTLDLRGRTFSADDVRALVTDLGDDCKGLTALNLSGCTLSQGAFHEVLAARKPKGGSVEYNRDVHFPALKAVDLKGLRLTDDKGAEIDAQKVCGKLSFTQFPKPMKMTLFRFPDGDNMEQLTRQNVYHGIFFRPGNLLIDPTAVASLRAQGFALTDDDLALDHTGQSAPAFVPSKPAWNGEEELRGGVDLGGETNARAVTTTTGTVMVKGAIPGADAARKALCTGHRFAEHVGLEVFRALGVKTPAHVLAKVPDGDTDAPAIVQEFVEHTSQLASTLTGVAAHDAPLQRKIVPALIAGALIGDTDVIGLCANNVLLPLGVDGKVDPHADPLFVDRGATFWFRASGPLANDAQRGDVLFNAHSSLDAMAGYAKFATSRECLRTLTPTELAAHIDDVVGDGQGPSRVEDAVLPALDRAHGAWTALALESDDGGFTSAARVVELKELMTTRGGALRLLSAALKREEPRAGEPTDALVARLVDALKAEHFPA